MGDLVRSLGLLSPCFESTFVWPSVALRWTFQKAIPFLRRFVLICRLYRDRWNIDKRAWRLTRYWFNILRVVLSMRLVVVSLKGLWGLRTDLIPFVQDFHLLAGCYQEAHLIGI